MAKSSSDASTKTITKYTTSTNTTVGLTGKDVNQLASTLTNFAIAETSAIGAMNVPHTADNSDGGDSGGSGGGGVSAKSIFSNPLIWVLIGGVVLLILKK